MIIIIIIDRTMDVVVDVIEVEEVVEEEVRIVNETSTDITTMRIDAMTLVPIAIIRILGPMIDKLHDTMSGNVATIVMPAMVGIPHLLGVRRMRLAIAMMTLTSVRGESEENAIDGMKAPLSHWREREAERRVKDRQKDGVSGRGGDAHHYQPWMVLISPALGGLIVTLSSAAALEIWEIDL